MGHPRDWLSEESQIEEDKYHVASLICKTEKKIIKMNLFTRQKQTQRLREWTFGYLGVRLEEKDS